MTVFKDNTAYIQDGEKDYNTPQIQDSELSVKKIRFAVMKTKRKFSAEFKAKVALEAVKGQMTLAELSTKYEINQNQICKWKRDNLNVLWEQGKQYG